MGPHFWLEFAKHFLTTFLVIPMPIPILFITKLFIMLGLTTKLFIIGLFTMRLLTTKLFTMRVFTTKLFTMRVVTLFTTKVFIIHLFTIRLFTTKLFITRLFTMHLLKYLNKVINLLKMLLISQSETPISQHWLRLSQILV